MTAPAPRPSTTVLLVRDGADGLEVLMVVRNERGVATGRTWEDFHAHALPRMRSHRASGGRGLRVLAEPSSSPTLEEARARFLAAYPEARWIEWDPLPRRAEREGARLAFGRPLRPVYRLDRADVIVSLDADLLIHHPYGVRQARDFAEGRRAERAVVGVLWGWPLGHSSALTSSRMRSWQAHRSSTATSSS